MLLSSFNSWYCIRVGKSCQMINTVGQGVLGRNPSLSLGGQLRKDLGVAEKV